MMFDITAPVNFCNIEADSEADAMEVVQRAVENMECSASVEQNEMEVEES